MLGTTRSGRQHSMCGVDPPSIFLSHSSRTFVRSLLMRHYDTPAGLVWTWFGTLVAVVLLSAARPVVGQTVIGSTLDANTSAPLSGVLISLLDSAGKRVRAVLSDEVGRFAMEVGQFGRYTIRAERIGLQTTTSESFDLKTFEAHEERILMGDRSVEIAGLVVDSRVRQCRNDPAEAIEIQRWWREVRTALDVSSVVQQEGIAQFELERFEREWGPGLQRIISSNTRTEMSLSNRPFVSAEAEYLASGGFVQGELTGQREYYAPDADVLLSSVFLSLHCFSITDHDYDERLVGLTFDPTRDNKIPEIMGTLWVDSTSAELQTLDFRYTNMSELPDNESGGYVSFEYLPSGAWIVEEWYIRMPRLGLQNDRGRDRLVLLGYVDVGGEVSLLATAEVSMERLGEVGSIGGLVFDSIRGRGLSDATVSILGTRFQARTNRRGEFVLSDVPVGEHHVTFFHDAPEAWGLGSPFLEVAVEADKTTPAYLALPGFRQAARIVCLGSGIEAEAVMLGKLIDRDGNGLGNIELEVTWPRDVASGLAVTSKIEARTGSDGRFVVCSIPAEASVSVRARIMNRWIDGFEVTLPTREIVFRQMMVPVPR